MLEWLTQTEYAVWVRQSSGWPIALTFHAFGTAVVLGLMAIICLRLLGMFRTIPYTSLNKLVAFVWIGLVVQVLSGFTLWMTKPADYLADVMFDSKFTLVIIASIVMWYFHSTMKREASAWEAKGSVSSRGLKIVAASTLLWAAVVIGGRLTAYLGSLYPS